MGDTLEIDRLTEADVDDVARVEPSQLGAADLAAERGRPWSRIWVAREADHGVVGFVVGWHVADEFHVLNLATRVDRRRRGFARALLQTVLAYAHAQGIRAILLEARISNEAAVALYRDLGFEVVGMRSRYYADGEDAVEMALALGAAVSL